MNVKFDYSNSSFPAANTPQMDSIKNFLTIIYDRVWASADIIKVATYALLQSYPANQDFTVDTDPWVLNGIYVNRTMELNPADKTIQFNYGFIDDFKAIQSRTCLSIRRVDAYSPQKNGMRSFVISPSGRRNQTEGNSLKKGVYILLNTADRVGNRFVIW